MSWYHDALHAVTRAEWWAKPGYPQSTEITSRRAREALALLEGRDTPGAKALRARANAVLQQESLKSIGPANIRIQLRKPFGSMLNV